MKHQNFDKLKISARYFLLGMAEQNPEYYKAVDALEKCLKVHNGFRNGGAPAAIHQLGIFSHIRTFHRVLVDPITVYCSIFCHDMIEDTDVKHDDLANEFGHPVAYTTHLLTKYPDTAMPGYYDAIFADQNASIVKLGDRCNNMGTAVGVFKPERLRRYYDETLTEFIPRISKVRKLFPQQESFYENAKLMLWHQLEYAEYALRGTTHEVPQDV